MSRSSPVTIIDIAKKLGLSKTTVSYALDGTGTISSKTREKVKATAASMGYKLNVFASSLAHHRSNKAESIQLMPVAILYEDVPLSSYVPGSEGILHAESLGFQCHLININDHRNLSALGKILHARGFVGIILGRIMRKIDPHDFPWEHFTVVAAGRYFNDWPCDVVCESEESNIRHALQLAKQRGYKRPGVCLIRHTQEAIDDWVRIGMTLGHDYLEKRRRKIPPFFEFEPEHKDYSQYARKVQKWYNKYQPDVVIAFGESTYYELKHMNDLRIPGDTSFISLRLYSKDSCANRFSGYFFTASQMLSAAFDRLSFLIRHNRKGLPPYRSQIIIEQPWIEGSTLPIKIPQ